MRALLALNAAIFAGAALGRAPAATAQDWPQWRGPGRDARAAGFEAPASWPAELTQKWEVAVGEGVASPSLVGDKLYVFARQQGNEILRCLNAATGDEIWKQEYPAQAIRGPAASFDGPRATPAVADGKVVVLGAQGMLTCYDAESGAQVWQKDQNVGDVPRFATSSSPIIIEGLAITQFGSDDNGGLVAYDLATGDERWKWTGSGAAYGSPAAMTIDGVEAIVSPNADKMVVVAAADGKVLWEMPYTQGRYNSASPIIDDTVLIMAGPSSGMTAFKLAKQGDAVVEEQVWKNADNSVGFNTPVATGGKLYGISGLNSLFAINIDGGTTAWNAPLGGDAQAQGGGQGRGGRGGGDAQRGGGRGGRGGGGGGGGYGSVVDAGSALIALTPTGQLTVFKPGDEFEQVATYKVAEGGTYAYPVPAKNGIYVKDQDSIALWATSP